MYGTTVVHNKLQMPHRHNTHQSSAVHRIAYVLAILKVIPSDSRIPFKREQICHIHSIGNDASPDYLGS